MSSKVPYFGSILVLGLTVSGSVAAQGGGGDHGPVERAKPTGPAAKKAAGLIADYKARIEKEIEQGRKEIERLRTELHELIDARYAIADSIAELRSELATMGAYSTDPVVNVQATPRTAAAPQSGAPFHRDFVFGVGSALAKAPTAQEREQLRRLMPRTDVKRMTERLRAEVDETRSEVDQLAYKLLELSAGVPAQFQGGMGSMGGMNGMNGQWFGSMEMSMMGGGMGGGMR